MNTKTTDPNTWYASEPSWGGAAQEGGFKCSGSGATEFSARFGGGKQETFHIDLRFRNISSAIRLTFAYSSLCTCA